MVPLGELFRPRKKEVEQLDSKDFLGKPKVTATSFSPLTEKDLSSAISRDQRCAGWAELAVRTQKPKFF